MLWDESHFHGGEETNGTYEFTVGFEPDGKVNAVKCELLWASQMMHATLGKFQEGTAIPHLYSREVTPYLSRGFNPCAKDGGPACAPPNLVFNQVAATLGMDPTKIALVNDGCEGRPMADFTKIRRSTDSIPNSTASRSASKEGRRRSTGIANGTPRRQDSSQRELSRDRFSLDDRVALPAGPEHGRRHDAPRRDGQYTGQDKRYRRVQPHGLCPDRLQ